MVQLVVICRGGSRWKLFARTALAILALSGPASAQRVAIPNFWDPRARAERPDVPAPVSEVVVRALEKEPAGRPPTATALANLLRMAAASGGG